MDSPSGSMQTSRGRSMLSSRRTFRPLSGSSRGSRVRRWKVMPRRLLDSPWLRATQEPAMLVYQRRIQSLTFASRECVRN